MKSCLTYPSLFYLNFLFQFFPLLCFPFVEMKTCFIFGFYGVLLGVQPSAPRVSATKICRNNILESRNIRISRKSFKGEKIRFFLQFTPPSFQRIPHLGATWAYDAQAWLVASSTITLLDIRGIMNAKSKEPYPSSPLEDIWEDVRMIIILYILYILDDTTYSIDENVYSPSML